LAENAKYENFDPFANINKNTFWTILKLMATTYHLVKTEHYKGVCT